jgi:hypothetical protein
MPAWRRAASLMLGAILCAATLTAGSRFAYCTAMGLFAGAHCACLARAGRTAANPAIEPTDCHGVVTVGALPAGALEDRGAPVPAAPHVDRAPVPTPDDAWRVAMAPCLEAYRTRPREGPAWPADAERTRLMVFLL